MKKTFNAFLLILTVLVFAPVFFHEAAASSWESRYPESENIAQSGVFTYFIQEDNTALIIGCDKNTSGSVAIPNTIKGHKVTGISEYAFEECDKITSLSIPDSVTYIGHHAFSDCIMLNEVTLGYIDSYFVYTIEAEGYDPHVPNSQQVKIPLKKIILKGTQTALPEAAFYNVTTLEEVVLPETIQTIGEFAFCRTKLKTISLPKALTLIGESAFSESSLTSITIPRNISIGKDVFHSCKELISAEIGTTELPEGIFKDCSALTKVTFTGNLKTIREYAFENCTSLTKISLPSSLTEIGVSAFEDCTALKTVDFSSGLERILDYAFSGCTSLKSVSLPDSLIKIESGAFSNCPNITYVKLPFVGEERSKQQIFDNVFLIEKKASLTVEFSSACTYIPSNAFHDNKALKKIILGENMKTIYASAFYGCVNLKEIVFSKKLETIKESAFSGCTSLTALKLPDSVKTLGGGCFYGCTALKSVKFGKNTQLVGDSAFSDCKKITTISFVPSIEEIGDSAFQGCVALKKVTLVDGLQKIGNEAFRDCTSLTSLYIPDSVTKIGSYILSGAKKCSTLRIPYFGEKRSKPSDLSWYNIPKAALKKLVIGDTCEEVPSEAVRDYENLKTVVIGKNVKTIHEAAFYNCKKLKNITIGNKITRLKQNVFENTAYVKNKANWNKQLLYVGKYLIKADENIKKATVKSGTRIICGGVFSLCMKLETVKLPSSVLTIESAAFWNCQSLKSINFPKKLTYIGEQAFAGCGGLKKISLPSSLEVIDDGAFWDCTGLRSVKIPDKVTKIGHEAFCACSSLEYVTIPRFATIGKDAFYYTQKLKCVSLCSTNSFYYDSFSGKHISFDGTKAELEDAVKGNKAAKFIKKNTVKYYTPKVIKKATLKADGKIKERCAVCGGYSYERKIASVESIKLEQTKFTYNGKAVKPAVLVKDSHGNVLEQGVDYTVTYAKGRKNVGTYKVTVKMKGNYSGKKTLIFKINPVKTTVSKLAADEKKIMVTISKKTTQVTGYQVQYSLSKTFSNATTKTIPSYKTTEYTLKKLGSKKTYYVRVRTYKKVGSTTYYSNWSAYKYIKAK